MYLIEVVLRIKKHFSNFLFLCLLFLEMQADAVVLLEAGDLDVPPSWLKPGAVVISCEPNLGTGVATSFWYFDFIPWD